MQSSCDTNVHQTFPYANPSFSVQTPRCLISGDTPAQDTPHSLGMEVFRENAGVKSLGISTHAGSTGSQSVAQKLESASPLPPPWSTVENFPHGSVPIPGSPAEVSDQLDTPFPVSTFLEQTFATRPKGIPQNSTPAALPVTGLENKVKASCPGRYESVSYQLGSERKESCYFVSTDYIRWEDGGYFCARHHGGYLAEFVYLAEWKAFKTFFTNIPKTTKEELYDTHVWIGASHVIGRNVWKWNGSEADFSQIVPRSQIPELELTPLKDLPEGDSYGLTVNVYSGEMEPYIFRTLSCLGCPTMHSYVCETDQPKEPLSPSAAKCQRDLQDGSRGLAQDLNRAEEEAKKISQNLTACERELKKSNEKYQSLVDQVLVADNILSQNLTDCRTELGRKEREAQDLVDCKKKTAEVEDALSLKEERISSLQGKLLDEREKKISCLEGELQKRDIISALEELLRERDEMISSLQRELEASRKTTALPATTEATTTLEQPPKPQEQATDFLIANMTFTVKKSDYQGDYVNGEAKSNIVEAGGLRWRVSVWKSDWTRFLVHAEGGRGSPSPWTLTVQSLTVKVLRKGGEGGAALTHRLEGATFSSEKEWVGVVSGWSWNDLTNPSKGFFDPQGTLHLNFFFEGAAMSPSPPPQRPTVPEAEATLQLRDLTTSLREEGDSMLSPSVHVGGKEWRVRAWRWRDGGYSFRLLCNPEERSDWSLEADYTITVLSAEGGGGNGKEMRVRWELSREYPVTFPLSIPRASIDRFLTGDTLSVRVKIRAHH
ncbi:unnamed protein product [Cyprideis torosa]|uniref:Uncharacterized protein n=1 Tax=Cyprideis torosa TaxID=163714 RepID=A0A7R8WKZ5_9CRUS|nr:unnamed protein product [Cyprideis torosa]CAG0897638.1 unnamed protein product [Cyprideis torosa]